MPLGSNSGQMKASSSHPGAKTTPIGERPTVSLPDLYLPVPGILESIDNAFDRHVRQATDEHHQGIRLCRVKLRGHEHGQLQALGGVLEDAIVQIRFHELSPAYQLGTVFPDGYHDQVPSLLRILLRNKVRHQTREPDVQQGQRQQQHRQASDQPPATAMKLRKFRSGALPTPEDVPNPPKHPDRRQKMDPTEEEHGHPKCLSTSRIPIYCPLEPPDEDLV